MNRDYVFTINGSKYVVVRRHAREMIPSWDGCGNPWLWFSWEQKTGVRDYLACGVKTLREAKESLPDTAEVKFDTMASNGLF